MNANATPENQIYRIGDTMESAIEDCRESLEQIKSSPDYELLKKVNADLKEISRMLWENRNLLNDELNFFVEVEHYTLYIISSNCRNHSFGHIECAIYLLNMFKHLIGSKFEYLTTKENLEKYELHLNEYPKRLYEFRMHFNENIFIKNPQFDEDIELLNLKLRAD